MYSKEGVWRRGIICYFFRGDVVLEVGKIGKRRESWIEEID